MNYKRIGRYFSAVLLIEAGMMMPALFVSILKGESAVIRAFLITIALIGLFAAPLSYYTRDAKRRFYAREGMVCVGLSWVIISLFGCLPFVITGAIPHFSDALFETVSGFTTTGASILSDVEAVPCGLLFWRSFTHWIGGMGVLVFMMTFLSDKGRDNGFTVHLLRAESPGPEVEKLLPHMRDSSILLYTIYIVLTILDIIFLKLGKMPWFDAFCIAFGTAGTGGFGVLNASMGSYSPYLQTVTAIFMLLFGINFNIFFFIILKKIRSVLYDEELRLYIGLALLSSLFIALNIRTFYATFGEGFHHAFFQVASIMTTTGYSTTDFDLWPSFSKAILLVLMIVGASAGSTGGGLKCARVLILAKAMGRHIRKAVYPQKVQVLKMSKGTLQEAVITNTSLYLVIYAFLTIGSFLIVSLDGYSLETSLSAVLACLNNIGPGFDAVGPMQNYGSLSLLSKTVLTIDMLAGRLELLPILSLVLKSTWRRH